MDSLKIVVSKLLYSWSMQLLSNFYQCWLNTRFHYWKETNHFWFGFITELNCLQHLFLNKQLYTNYWNDCVIGHARCVSIESLTAEFSATFPKQNPKKIFLSIFCVPEHLFECLNFPPWESENVEKVWICSNCIVCSHCIYTISFFVTMGQVTYPP